MSKKKSQIDKLYNRLLSGKNLTKTEAKKRLGITSLKQRVHDLRNEGYEIFTNRVKVNGRSVTAYRLDV